MLIADNLAAALCGLLLALGISMPLLMYIYGCKYLVYRSFLKDWWTLGATPSKSDEDKKS